MTRKALSLEFEIGEPVVTLNRWQRWHYRRKRRYQNHLAWLIRAAAQPPVEPIDPCRITVVRYSSQRADLDGLYGGLKPLLDCLILPSRRSPNGLGFIRDDSPDHLMDLQARQEIAPPKKGGTFVRIEEV